MAKRQHGVVVTHVDNLDQLAECLRRGEHDTIKVVTKWGMDGGWTPEAMRRVLNMAQHVIVRTVTGDPSFDNHNPDFQFPDDKRVKDELEPWYAIRKDIMIEIGNEPNIDDHPSQDFMFNYRASLEVAIAVCRSQFRRAELISPGLIVGPNKEYNAAGEPITLEPFELFSNESQGTHRLFSLAEPILTTLRGGTVLVIDEIDARLHPIITCEIIKLFNSPKTNPRHAQLIFTTHDTNLLGSHLFRRDQIWFIEKSSHGESTLYSLAEYRVRNDASYEKNYIQGRYGAIPFIGDFSTVVGEPYDQAQNGAEDTEEQESFEQEDDDSFLLATPDRHEG